MELSEAKSLDLTLVQNMSNDQKIILDWLNHSEIVLEKVRGSGKLRFRHHRFT